MPTLNANVNWRTVIETFAPNEDVQHALFLTYNFDGPFLEDPDRGLLETLWQRNCANVIVLRDGKAVIAEKTSHRYSVVNVASSERIFHSKLMLLLSPAEALMVIGSANLTRGGLANNLELAGVYRLTRTSGPLTLFASLRVYLREKLIRELAAASPQQRAAYDALVKDLERFVQGARPERGLVEPLLLHNYDQPLLPQIIAALPSPQIESLWVVSPFFEPDPSAPKRELEPPDDILDETLLDQIFNAVTFPTGQPPPVRIYFPVSATNVTNLPLETLARFRSRIELYAKDSTASDQRTLHAKLLVFRGRLSGRKAQEPFVTVVYGSANFTRAALLSTPKEGNAEIVVVTHLPRAKEVSAKLEDYLNLAQLFTRIENWAALSQAPLPPPPKVEPVIMVWEGVASLSSQTLSVFFRVTGTSVYRVRVTLCGDQSELPVGDLLAPFADCHDLHLPEAALSTIGIEMGLHRLAYHRIRLEAFNAAGQLLGQGEGALNVDCPGDFCGDRYADKLWLDTLDAQILQAGLGNTSSYAALRAWVERLTGPHPPHPISPLPSHQADLDLFFRRLHSGFRGLHRQVEQSHGSLYELSRVLRQLARWGELAIQDENYSPEQRLYLCDHILQTAMQCADTVKKVRGVPNEVLQILGEEFLPRGRCMLGFALALQTDETIGMVVPGFVDRWHNLERMMSRGR